MLLVGNSAAIAGRNVYDPELDYDTSIVRDIVYDVQLKIGIRGLFFYRESIQNELNSLYKISMET